MAPICSCATELEALQTMPFHGAPQQKPHMPPNMGPQLPHLAPIPKPMHRDLSQSSGASSSSSSLSSDPREWDDTSSSTSRHPARLTDTFQVSDKVLGSGQFGTVSECRSNTTGELLACKTITKGGLFFSRENDIRHEVDMMARVARHEGVVQLRGVFEEEGQVHLVMDLCQGGELFDEIMRRRMFCEQDAAVLFSQVTQAVAFCHAQGVVHRDLKPENILLTRKLPPSGSLCEEATEGGPLVKLADFGFAAFVNPGETISGAAGSPFYVAPEVLVGRYDSKADVWSLGVILHILLTGEPPFWGETDAEVFKSILNDDVDFADKSWKGVSMEAKSLVRCCLNKDPTRRPSAEKIISHPWFSMQMSSNIYA